MIIISADKIEKQYQARGSINVFFNSWDQGDVYNLFTEAHPPGSVPGSIHFVDRESEFSLSDLNEQSYRVTVVLRQKDAGTSPEASKRDPIDVRGYVFKETRWNEERIHAE